MKRRFILLGVGAALVVLLWSGAWLVASGLVKGQIAALANADGITEAKIDCGELGVGGFPFRFDVTCTNAEIVSGDLQIAVNELRATAMVYRPSHVLIFAHSPGQITDAFSGATRELRWSNMEASVRLDGWRLGRASLIVESPALYDTLVGETRIAGAQGFQLHLLDIPERYDSAAGTQSLALYQQTTTFDMPASDIENGASEAEAEINLLPADVRLWGDPGFIRRWQGLGGTLKLVSLNVSDTKRSASADGEFGLSDNGALNGRLNLTSNGLVEEFGDLLPEAYRQILFSNPAEDGSYSNAIRFTNGVATAGLLPVGMIAPLF
jgi:hypothetical protein